MAKKGDNLKLTAAETQTIAEKADKFGAESDTGHGGVITPDNVHLALVALYTRPETDPVGKETDAEFRHRLWGGR